MDRIPLAVLRFHEIGMARFLKGIVLVMACGEDGKCLVVAGSLHDGRLDVYKRQRFICDVPYPAGFCFTA